METRKKGKATIGIAMAAIMLASVFAATVPIISAESRGDNFNHIVKQAEPQKVLIGQNLQFEGFDVPPTVYRFVSGDIENTYKANDDSRIYNVNWPTRGLYYVNCNRSNLTDCDAPLLVEFADIPLELKDVDTMLIVDTTRINMLPQDLVDLVIIGPDGQIKIDKMNNQTFTNITVSQLMVFCDVGLKTEGWKVGNYTFQVKTRSTNACGLEAASAIMILEIIKGWDFIIIQHVHNINTGENFSSIQAAIDDNDTDDGHTITVDAGTYYESVVVNKSVTLKGIGNPIMDGGGKRNAITLTAYGITLAGFNVTNSGSYAGIKVISSNNTLSGNNVCNNWNGIYLSSSNYNTITGNNVSNNGGNGIYLQDSNNNRITDTDASNNDNHGISLGSSNNNEICNNIANDNHQVGIGLWTSEDNIIANNTAKNNGNSGFFLKESNTNRITDSDASNNVNYQGISLHTSNNNAIRNNRANSNNYYGIGLWTSEGNIIANNTAKNNGNDGLYLSYSSNNSITGNSLSNNNGNGIEFDDSCNNNITGNTFVNDGLSVCSSYQNTVEDNTVNGKPLVYLEDASDYVVGDAGQVILVNCNNITVENLDLSNTSVGLALWNTEDSKILNNTASSNNHYGIELDDSSNNNTITGNNVNNNWDGIYLSYSSNNTIKSNNLSNNSWTGIGLYYSSNNTITGNNVSSNNDEGIALYESSNNTITGNNVRNNGDGIRLYSSSNNNTITGNTFVNDGFFVYYSYQNTVEDNTVNGKPLVYLEDDSDYKVEDAGQVILVNCSNISVENLDLSNTSVGIELLETEDSKVLNNTANNWRGIYLYLYRSSNNSITSNNVCNNNWNGISLYDSSNNIITGNNVSNNNWNGISFSSSSNNIITGNKIRNNNDDGIRFDSSSNNTIIGNTFVNDGLSVRDSYQNTVEDNIVNGKPLVYLEDVSDYKVEDAGQVIFVNCNNITVENLDLSNTSFGIELWKTEDSIISNNAVSNNNIGIYLGSSSNNNITGNNANNNDDGIRLHESRNNTFTGNNACNNDDGIILSDSSNNSITGNNVSNNSEGISLYGSSNNNIYLNNLINNTDNVYSYESTNIWNTTKKITYTHNGSTYTNYLGNYWGDYEEKYPDAEEIDTTGIWDMSYRLNRDKDNYPLMERIENYIIP